MTIRAVLSLFCTLLVTLSVAPRADTTKPRTILVMGDSLSAAYKMPEEHGWVTLLADELKKDHPTINVINASISGATTSAGLHILPQAIREHKPDIIILELGANDGLQGKPIKYITANLTQLINISQDADAKVLLLGIRLPPNYGEAYTTPFYLQYQQLAATFDITLIPFFLDGIAGKEVLMMSDGLHPNQQAQTLILANIYPKLMGLIRP